MKAADSARPSAARRPAGSELSLRVLEPTDRDQIAGLAERLSSRPRDPRCRTPLPSLSEQCLGDLASIDHEHHEAVGVFEAAALVGAAHYVRADDATDQAEITVEVADSHQRRGVATWLVNELSRLARGRGISRFTATVLPDNRAALSLLGRFGTRTVIRSTGRELHITVTIADGPPAR